MSNEERKWDEMHRVSGRRLLGGRARMLVAVMALAVPLAALGTAAPAMASNPYEKYFSQCPATAPGIELCLYAEITSGEVAIGKTKVPILNKIIQQGGAVPDPYERQTDFLIPAKNGESLSKTEQNVPGGLLDLINCEEIKGEGIWEKIERASCKLIFENKTTGVTEVTELVATEHNPATLNFEHLLGETGTALTLPTRVHLKNPLLGNSCYIGSESSPVQLHLTTGTTSPPGPNKPISGKLGELTEEAGEVLVVSNNSLVDNSFSAPKAEGCGEFFSFLIDPIVDSKLGLESKAGNNTAILNGVQRVADAEEVAKG
jgi:hypothetical protein